MEHRADRPARGDRDRSRRAVSHRARRCAADAAPEQAARDRPAPPDARRWPLSSRTQGAPAGEPGREARSGARDRAVPDGSGAVQGDRRPVDEATAAGPVRSPPVARRSQLPRMGAIPLPALPAPLR
ncbi:MAG: hypothetical protein AMS20_08215 [Gemmatimonas sp. SG8_28]|nr:MAG: hypothetical protein AMS20_08215 [Gemmatimonas sp. SG8_28]